MLVTDFPAVSQLRGSTTLLYVKGLVINTVGLRDFTISVVFHNANLAVKVFLDLNLGLVCFLNLRKLRGGLILDFSKKSANIILLFQHFFVVFALFCFNFIKKRSIISRSIKR